MRVRDIMAFDIHELAAKDSVDQALLWMDEAKLSQLPLVNDGNLEGLLFEEDLLEEDPDSKIGSIKSTRPITYILESQHYYDVMKMLAETGLSLVPVLNEHKKYLGVVTLKDVIKAIGSTATMSENGAVIVLEVRQRDYSLMQIANIVEGNDCKILSSYISNYKNQETMDVTIKLNKSNVDGVIQTFIRYSYTIKESYQHSDFEELIKRRYDELMNYLNL